MPDNAERWAVDTSMAIAALDAGHAAHTFSRDFVRAERPALAGHAAIETYAVLTRMPGALSVDPPTASDLIRHVFPTMLELPVGTITPLLERLGRAGLAGGAVYDALVAEAARSTGHRLASRDQRARRTYDLVGVDYQLFT